MTVAEEHAALGVFRDIGLVRHHDDGDAFGIERAEEGHDLFGRLAVEGARRLVGEQELGIIDERARDGDALLLPARKLARIVVHAVFEADLLETVEGEPGSHDRTHHHPRFRGWEPGRRRFDELVGREPVEWVGEQLGDLDALVARSEVEPSEVDPDDARQLREAVPEILDVVRRLLDRVRAGELAVAPGGSAELGARNGWL